MNIYLSDLTDNFILTGEIERDSYEFLVYHNYEDIAEHSLKVAMKAEELAEKFGIDKDLARIAGYLHDIGRVVSEDKKINLAEKLGIDVLDEERIFPEILHGKLSAVMAYDIFGIEDVDILNVIKCHTTLKANADKLDLILFIADKLSWDSNDSKEILDGILNGLEESLGHSAFSYIEHLWNNRNNLKVLHPRTQDAYFDLKDRYNN
ncbi:bis(5'-nucleosyl)-tetraphosphatase (symmetrical) YqeK [Clostridium sp. D2Q-14]|uniref:bis(5'-nucleosyl)-tetraphosphatase (symmetrical) YqeK n=1 Tax=Anaeromonas gelatinilytica TaxID=2683194 RepID=UPI00193B23A0|nr:bis(5'-nucleosyl)-tetraphosphatase (symmetrical) YqeK [Anaeromonas gelatinilytica]MBS4535320.1 bis(5'-nucleosyl)-tetraphosphatase (symmetrical) YqeK [Anaeromonas gelatinilytica]